MTTETVTDDNGVEQEAISRAEAKARGLKFYFLGADCKNGHVSTRYTSSGDCSLCAIAKAKAKRNRDPEEYKRHIREWHAKNADRVNENIRKKRQENSEEWRLRDREYYQKNRDKKLHQRRMLYQEDPSKAKAWCRNYYKNNSEKIAGKVVEWRKNNPIKLKAQRTNRKSRLKKAKGFHSSDDIQRIYLKQGKRCAYCSKRIAIDDSHVDHIIPISKGGSNWPDNICISCPTCNLRKNAKDPIEFARERGLLI